jgi:prepilin-type N-terminal cleavage/methylation domain-containing protein
MQARSPTQFRRSSRSAIAVSASGRPDRRGRRAAGAFTLIELILVMAILTVMVSFTAPALARFFGGRTLDSEARRLLALTRHGQSRAVSEGLTMDLWVDAEKGKLGLQIEPSFDTDDPKKEEFDLDSLLKIEASSKTSMTTSNSVSGTPPARQASILKKMPVHPGVPTITFLPDGSIGDGSPVGMRLYDRDGASIWVAQAKNRMSYEIRDTEN